MAKLQQNMSSRRLKTTSFRPSLEILEDRLAPATYTVTQLGDAGKADPDPQKVNSGDLVWCVDKANQDVTPDAIVFNLPGVGAQTILLRDRLVITNKVTINGYTQQGAMPNNAIFGTPINSKLLVVLQGVERNAKGIELDCNGSTIKGLVFQSFTRSAIQINGSYNNIQGCFIGTDVTGTIAVSNKDGIVLRSGSTNNTVGGATPADRNLIAGNTDSGVVVHEANTNVIQGNYIGSNAAGTKTVGSQQRGVLINDGSNNTIGGMTNEASNLISGNVASGVLIMGSSAFLNRVIHNRIGTTAAGNASLPNGRNGILIDNAPFNLIGGPQVSQRNTISGNGDLSVDSGNSRLNAYARTGNGVLIVGSQAILNQVVGNYIGTDTTGKTSVPNSTGVLLLSVSFNVIGGKQPGAGNVISGNAHDGLVIMDANTSYVSGNTIGLNEAGSAKIPNKGNGITINGSRNIVIGGTTVSSRNLISGNGNDPAEKNKGNGLFVLGSSYIIVQGNYIGTDKVGMIAIPNLVNQVSVNSGDHNQIGGANMQERNLLGGDPDTVIFNNPNDTILGNTMLGKKGALLPNQGDSTTTFGQQVSDLLSQLSSNSWLIGNGVFFAPLVTLLAGGTIYPGDANAIGTIAMEHGLAISSGTLAVDLDNPRPGNRKRASTEHFFLLPCLFCAD